MNGKPRDRLFSEADRAFKELLEKGRAAFEHHYADHQRKRKPHPRQVDEMWPFLVVRSRTGDGGARPIVGGGVDHSPDIWVLGNQSPGGAPDRPQPPPAIPGALSFPQAPTFVRESDENTIYAHVWNLGRAPVGGVRVEFYERPWGLTHPVLIGVEYVDLPPRSSIDCHRLVKCQTAWRATVPPPVEVPPTNAMAPLGSHLVVRASSFDDPVKPTSWDPTLDRHVATRTVLVTRRPR
jgi:hypothetical protein